MTNIIFFYTYPLRSEVCFTNILSLQDKYNIKMESLDTKDPFAYYEALNKYWGEEEDIIMIEHDHLVSPDMLDSLIDCKEKACCYAYETSIEKEFLNIGYRIQDPTYNMLMRKNEFDQLKEFTKNPTPYVTFTGMGLSRISKEWQQNELVKFSVRNRPEFPRSGINVDNAIIATINKQIDAFSRWHCHGYVPHLHPNLLSEEIYSHRYEEYLK